MSINARHFATPYYLPSWQGGDVLRAICRTGLAGYPKHVLTRAWREVNCPKCLARMPRFQEIAA